MPDEYPRTQLEKLELLRRALENTQAEADDLHQRVHALLERDAAENDTPTAHTATPNTKT